MGVALVPMAVAGVGERGSGDGQRGGAGNENKLVHLMFLMPLEWVGAGCRATVNLRLLCL
jgi:hypothetical protein